MAKDGDLVLPAPTSEADYIQAGGSFIDHILYELEKIHKLFPSLI